MCARTGRVGQAHCIEPRAFPLGRPVSDERRRSQSFFQSKRKRHHIIENENEKRGCARADSVGRINEEKNKKYITDSKITVFVVSPLRGGDRRWGEDSFLSPNRCSAFRVKRGIGRTPSNLGARSPSGNARGGCRGLHPRTQTLARNKHETKRLTYHEMSRL